MSVALSPDGKKTEGGTELSGNSIIGMLFGGCGAVSPSASGAFKIQKRKPVTYGTIGGSSVAPTGAETGNGSN